LGGNIWRRGSQVTRRNDRKKLRKKREMNSDPIHRRGGVCVTKGGCPKVFKKNRTWKEGKDHRKSYHEGYGRKVGGESKRVDKG